MAIAVQKQASEINEEVWRLDLAAYAQIISDGAWKPYRWSVWLADKVQAAIEKGKSRILISVPPRHGKSELCSKYLPLWFLDQNPEKKVILTSYEKHVATDWGRAVRNIAETNPECWVNPSSSNRSASDWKTVQGGGMKCAGSGGPITGKGFHLGIIDDPIKNWKEAYSPVIQAELFKWFWSTFYTRCEPGGTIIGIMTRWAQGDLFGRLLADEEHGEDFEYIRLPAIAENDDDLLGRKQGEALCPERFNEEDLEQIKSKMPPYIWAGLYQQRPSPAEGSIVKDIWLEYCSRKARPKMSKIVQSWDFSFKKTGTSFVCGLVFGLGTDGKIYLLDRKKERLGLVGSLDAVRAMVKKWPRSKGRIVIEDKANGSGIVEVLQREFGKKVVVEYRPKGSKEERLEAVTPTIFEGDYVLPDPEEEPWVTDYVDELTTFPSSANDDQVDATSQGLSFLGELKSSTKASRMNIKMSGLENHDRWSA